MHLHIGQAQLLNRTAHRAQISRMGVADLHERAAGEFHRQMQPTRKQEKHRCEERDERDDIEHERMPHERDVASDFKELHEYLPLVCVGLSLGLWPPNRANRQAFEPVLATVP